MTEQFNNNQPIQTEQASATDNSEQTVQEPEQSVQEPEQPVQEPEQSVQEPEQTAGVPNPQPAQAPYQQPFGQPYQPPYQQPFQPQYQQPVYPMPVVPPYQDKTTEVLSVGSYLVMFVISGIPLVNIICWIVWLASDTTNKNKKNYIIAMLVYSLIISAVSVLIFVLLLVLGVSLTGLINY